jgi:hypothetical protein
MGSSEHHEFSEDLSKSVQDPEQFMRKIAALMTSILVFGLLESCSTDQKEVGRQISPNEKLVAVLTETLTGGTVQEAIYLNDLGVPLNLDKPVFNGVGCDHLSINWANDYTLQIHYETTCAINQFTNRWYRPADLAVGRPVPIEIILVRN